MTMTPDIIGIDPSLSNTAICVYRTTQVTEPWTGCYKTKPAGMLLADRIHRYNSLAMRVMQIVSEANPQAIFIEGPSFGSQGRATLDLAEYRGVLSQALCAACPTVIEVSPLTLKLFTTGKGAGDKTMMIAAIVKRYGVMYETNDEYDAFALCRFGACYLGIEKPATEFQERAIEKLRNPEAKPKKAKKKSVVPESM